MVTPVGGPPRYFWQRLQARKRATPPAPVNPSVASVAGRTVAQCADIFDLYRTAPIAVCRRQPKAAGKKATRLVQVRKFNISRRSCMRSHTRAAPQALIAFVEALGLHGRAPMCVKSRPFSQ